MRLPTEWQLVPLVAGALLVSSSLAATEPTLPLPSEVDFGQAVQRQVSNTPFSTDPRASRVAATVSADDGAAEVFISNSDPCVQLQDAVAYRITVRNISDRDLLATRLTLTTGDHLDVTSLVPVTANPPDGEPIVWEIGALAPGATRHFNVSFQVTRELITEVTAFFSYTGGVAATRHTIDEACEAPPVFAEAPLKEKLPAIICDPAELGCVEVLPELGIRFGRAAEVVINEAGFIISAPDLGPRFNTAIADIIPGECRVLADDIVAHPAFHDAFLRFGNAYSGLAEADPANPYTPGLSSGKFLEPLFQSGQDFAQALHENSLLNIRHRIAVQDRLRPLHQQNWRELTTFITNLAEGRATLGQLAGSIDTWVTRLTQAQPELRGDYEAKQTVKRGKFAPIAAEAVTRARTVIGRACRGPGSDGGLAALLEPVGVAYQTLLDDRQAAHVGTQISARTAYQAELDTLRATITAAAGSPEALRSLATTSERASGAAFVALLKPYRDHLATDEASEERLRRRSFETALDAPKAIATDCEKDVRLGPNVETTWCESGSYPQLVLPAAIDTPRRPVTPPETIPGGAGARINPFTLAGVVCGLGPGDPYWAPDCSCKCGDVINCPGQGETLCEDCLATRPTRHDRHVTSRLECVNESLPGFVGFPGRDPERIEPGEDKHADPFL